MPAYQSYPPSLWLTVRPHIDSVAPNTAVANAGDVAITVTGADFTAGSVVMFANVAVATVFVSATSLTATIPNTVGRNPGTFMVTVDDPTNGVSNAVGFILTATQEVTQEGPQEESAANTVAVDSE